MRLTLRTLLAYLDDVLDPAETKLIGQKIQESAVAGKLVSLIRLVVRQRRLKAPSVSGPNIGIDPNVVAQYIDNTLTPEQVVEVEKVLLTSDELLAEVASCHQVLAMIPGKPTEISQVSRERLYALGPVDQGDQLHVEEPATPNSNHAAHAAASREVERLNDGAAPKSAVAKPVPVEIPEYLRQPSWSQRVFPAAIVALLVIVCAGLLISDPGFLTGIREAKRELTTTERDGTAGDSTAKPPEGVTVPDSGLDQVAATAPGTAPGPVPVVPGGVDQPPPPDVPDVKSDGTTALTADAPADAVLVANRAVPSAVAAPPAATPPGNGVPAPILNPVPVQYISNEGVVLRLDEVQHHWFLLPRRSVVASGELLAVLEPFEAVLDIDRGAMIATVMGDSALRLLPPDRTTACGMDIRRGRILLRSSRKDPAQVTDISIMVGDDLWRLEFLSADTVCTLEVTPREPVQFEKPLGPNWYVGVLRVLSGSVKWTAANGLSQQVGKESALEITRPQPDQGVGPAPVSSAFAPEWTDPQKRKLAPLRRFAALFEKQFEIDQPVEMSLLALIKDSNAKIVELAVRGLSVTESHSGMVQALAECSFEEGRFAARDGIRGWLAREAGRGPMLKEILEQRYPVPEANAIYIMLWGFRPEDATNRAISLELVNWLRSPYTEIRELAYFWIVNLTQRKWEFRAADVPMRRESAVRRIENHIISAGALVKPVEKEAVRKPE